MKIKHEDLLIGLIYLLTIFSLIIPHKQKTRLITKMRDIFQPAELKTKKNPIEWEMNEGFETNVEIIVHSF